VRYLVTVACVGRLGAAALLATAGLLGTTASTLGDPATACAAPNWDYYRLCIESVLDDYANGKITEEEADRLIDSCCIAAGGELEEEGGNCNAPDEDSPAQLPQVPSPTKATQVPPPAGPIVPLPGAPQVQTR
jgi:hypothetical protein